LQELIIPGQILGPDSSYVATFEVSTANGDSSSSSYAFYVQGKPVVAVIDGGNRLVPYLF